MALDGYRMHFLVILLDCSFLSSDVKKKRPHDRPKQTCRGRQRLKLYIPSHSRTFHRCDTFFFSAFGTIVNVSWHWSRTRTEHKNMFAWKEGFVSEPRWKRCWKPLFCWDDAKSRRTTERSSAAASLTMLARRRRLLRSLPLRAETLISTFIRFNVSVFTELPTSWRWSLGLVPKEKLKNRRAEFHTVCTNHRWPPQISAALAIEEEKSV